MEKTSDKKRVTFGVEEGIHTFEVEERRESKQQEKCDPLTKGIRRELTSLGNPWKVSSPALRQLCTVIPRKRESFGACLKVLNCDVHLQRSVVSGVHKNKYNKKHSCQREVQPNSEETSATNFQIYPVLSRITPSSIPTNGSDKSQKASRTT